MYCNTYKYCKAFYQATTLPLNLNLLSVLGLITSHPEIIGFVIYLCENVFVAHLLSKPQRFRLGLDRTQARSV